MSEKPPRVSIIIPSFDGYRGGLLPKLLEDLKKQTFSDYEVIVQKGYHRQGRAINDGVKKARGEIVMTMDDDTVPGNRDLVERIVAAVDSDPKIGLAGASCLPPRDASEFQREASRQIPRRFFPVVKKTIDSDMVQHPCLAARKEVFLEVGGEDEELIRGLDPLLRHRMRKAGYRVVIVAGTWVSHPMPDSFPKVLKMYFRNGRGSAFARRHYPERIYELGSGFEGDDFAPKKSFASRVFRRVWSFARSVVDLEIYRTGTDIAYALGFLYETVFVRSGPDPGKGHGV
ncbi:MAG: glycosyltransferase [Planctomycetota bacterium]|nr:MAG: glycosyltransferase [Planctomycetota bacterium]